MNHLHRIRALTEEEERERGRFPFGGGVRYSPSLLASPDSRLGLSLPSSARAWQRDNKSAIGESLVTARGGEEEEERKWQKCPPLPKRGRGPHL